MMLPKSPKRLSDRAWMARVAALPCVIGFDCEGPVQVHHVIHGRYSQQKASDRDTIPLCLRHHAALHAGKRTWQDQHGRDTDYLAQVRAQLEGEK